MIRQKIKDILSEITCSQAIQERHVNSLRLGEFHPDKMGLIKGGFLHELLDGLTEEQVAELQADVGKEFCPELIDFYRESNGLSLFCGSMKIYGGLMTPVQPISLRYGNVWELPRKANRQKVDDREHLYIGSYCVDKSHIKVNLITQQVILEPDERWGEVVCIWENLAEFLNSEFMRMSEYYKNVGGAISALEPVPPPVRKLHG